MSDGYTKLFSDIVDSSIWSEDAETCKVWVTLLALSNSEGFVRGSISWLASKAKVSVNICQRALTKFTEPDLLSRTPDNEGRRIEVVDRGWVILNYRLFRQRSGLSEDPRRIYQREWMRNKRQIQKSQQSQQSQALSTPASASASYLGIKEGSGNHEGAASVLESDGPDDAWIKSWVEKKRKLGADYRIEEALYAASYFRTNGWKLGSNTVVDWGYALERQIGSDRQHAARNVAPKPVMNAI